MNQDNPNPKKVVLLTSRQNLVWSSMEEIIPMIIVSWEYLCEKNDNELTVINVDQENPNSNFKKLFVADVVVVTCYNVKIARFIELIRGKFCFANQIVFYLHGLATVALWPLEKFGTLKHLNTGDLFVGTCRGDDFSLQLALKNFRFLKVPFCEMKSEAIKAHKETLIPYVFIGRISPQKNLDKLIWAYSLFEKSFRRQHPLMIFGKEDHLGYPNLGIENSNYLNELKLLTKNLNLTDDVIFKGFVKRELIFEELKGNYIFVGPSTHSDENFGMAAYRSLVRGAICVLSNWGGHKEFYEFWSNQIVYVNPSLFGANCFPSVSSYELHTAMLYATEKWAQRDVAEEIYQYRLGTIADQLVKSVDVSNNNMNNRLELTMMANEICEFQKLSERDGFSQRCFQSSLDPNFIAFFNAYSAD